MSTEKPPSKESPALSEGIEVEISDTQAHVRIDRAALVALVRGVLAGEGVVRATLSIALVDDASIRAINREHLDHDWPTDVISFPLSEAEASELAGELVVSAEMAAATAREAGVEAWPELALYVVHGLLHLCGYDDATESAAAAMRRRESEVLAREGLMNTFPLVGPERASNPEPGRGSARWSV